MGKILFTDKESSDLHINVWVIGIGRSIVHENRSGRSRKSIVAPILYTSLASPGQFEGRYSKRETAKLDVKARGVFFGNGRV